VTGGVPEEWRNCEGVAEGMAEDVAEVFRNVASDVGVAEVR
jgi:hypothetical protein